MKKTCKFLILLFIPIISNYNLSGQIFQKISEPINKEGEKRKMPYVSIDGLYMAFIIEYEDSVVLAEANKKSYGQWSVPETVNFINFNQNKNYIIEAPAYNQDASVMYFGMKHINKDSLLNIYKSERIQEKWSKPKKLGNVINTNANETDPCISPDGKYMYFTRDNGTEIEGELCYKIFVSELKNGKWTKAYQLPDLLNEGCNRAPRISADGKTLYISSLKENSKKGFDLYVAKMLIKDVWTQPIPLDTINTEEDEMYASVSYTGKNLIFEKKEGKRKKMTKQIFSANVLRKYKPENSVIIKGKVTDLNSSLPLDAIVDVKDPASSLTISSWKTNHKGEYSLSLKKGRRYRIDIHKEGYSHSFSTVNTEKIRESSAKTEDVKLYSSANLLLNVFDNEIFEPQNVNVKILDQKTANEVNVKMKTLSEGRYYITLPLGKEYRILAENENFNQGSFILNLSDVVQFGEFERDIELSIKKVDVEISLRDSETGGGIETEIEITNLSTNETITVKGKTDEKGKLKIKLRKGDKYQINVTPKGYSFYSTSLDLSEEERNAKVDAEIDPLKKASKIKLNNINFESNSADLNETSYEELNRVIKLMNTNPQIKMEISAHTDDVGTDIYNLKLSDKRAASVVSYLIENGVDKTKLVSKGYGESSPAFTPANTDENRAKNRRVELKVIDITN